MVSGSLTIRKAVFILIAVAVVAIVTGVLTAKYIGNMGLVLIALAAGFGGFLLYVYASSEAKKIARSASGRKTPEDPRDSHTTR